MSVTLASSCSSLARASAHVRAARAPAPAPVSVTSRSAAARPGTTKAASVPARRPAAAWNGDSVRKWSVGADVERARPRARHAGLEWSGRTVFASANIAYRFAARGVSPYVGGGFGGAFYEGELIDRFDAPAAARSPQQHVDDGVRRRPAWRFRSAIASPSRRTFRITFCQPPDDFAPWSTMRFGVKAACPASSGRGQNRIDSPTAGATRNDSRRPEM